MVYEFLDDTYSCSKWLNQVQVVRQFSLTDSGRNNLLNGNEEPNVSVCVSNFSEKINSKLFLKRFMMEMKFLYLHHTLIQDLQVK